VVLAGALLALLATSAAVEGLPHPELGEGVEDTAAPGAPEGALAQLGELLSMQNATNATGAGAPLDPAAMPAMIITPAPPTAEQMARMKAYMPKIKEFQKDKGEDWGEDVEDDLAKNLVMVDELMESTHEEREIEKELRAPTNVTGMEVELSLKRNDMGKEERIKKEEEAKKAEASEVAEKKQRKDDINAEDKKMRLTLANFAKSSQSKAEAEQLAAAHRALDVQKIKVKKLKNTDHFKSFQKQFTPQSSVEEEPDYPKNRLGEAKGESQNDHIVQRVAEVQAFRASEDSDAADLSPTRSASMATKVDQQLSSEALKELADLKKTLKDSGVTR